MFSHTQENQFDLYQFRVLKETFLNISNRIKHDNLIEFIFKDKSIVLRHGYSGEKEMQLSDIVIIRALDEPLRCTYSSQYLFALDEQSLMSFLSSTDCYKK